MTRRCKQSRTAQEPDSETQVGTSQERGVRGDGAYACHAICMPWGICMQSQCKPHTESRGRTDVGWTKHLRGGGGDLIADVLCGGGGLLRGQSMNAHAAGCGRGPAPRRCQHAAHPWSMIDIVTIVRGCPLASCQPAAAVRGREGARVRGCEVQRHPAPHRCERTHTHTRTHPGHSVSRGG